MDKALNVQYVPFGRDYDGWDCWGLVYCAYRDVRNIQLPLLSDKYSDTLDKAEIDALIKSEEEEGINWKETAWPELTDLVVLMSTARMCHVGILIEKGWVLHALPDRGTTCERLNSPFWNKRFRGYAKYVGKPV